MLKMSITSLYLNEDRFNIIKYVLNTSQSLKV